MCYPRPPPPRDSADTIGVLSCLGNSSNRILGPCLTQRGDTHSSRLVSVTALQRLTKLFCLQERGVGVREAVEGTGAARIMPMQGSLVWARALSRASSPIAVPAGMPGSGSTSPVCSFFRACLHSFPPSRLSTNLTTYRLNPPPTPRITTRNTSKPPK